MLMSRVEPAMIALVKILRIMPVFILSAFTIACGSENQAEYEIVASAAINPGDEIPTPSGDVVLIVSGDVTNTNVGDTIQFDMNTLEKIGLVSYEVSDPWLLENITYTGVLLSDLLKVANASDTMTEVFASALDGYAISIPLSEIEAWPVLVATQSNGAHMAVENSGPTRIIFPYDSHDDITYARNMSVWNLESLDVR
jgi:hypothetical protein